MQQLLFQTTLIVIAAVVLLIVQFKARARLLSLSKVLMQPGLEVEKLSRTFRSIKLWARIFSFSRALFLFTLGWLIVVVIHTIRSV